LIVLWHSSRKKSGDIYVTKHLDDYFPYPRKITRNNNSEPEERYHKKLNYQFLIEKLTRKLFLTFIGIMLFSTSFIYVLYKTSLGETIAPEENVMEQYESMLYKIMTVEDSLEAKQLASLSDFENDSLKYNMITYIKQATVENEDKLILDVSNSFFNIYFFRYITVRLFVAGVMFTLMGYLIRLFFRIRADRNDLIRKEEALSILFYLLDEIEGNNKEGKAKYLVMKDKIPEFPLNKLFEGGSSSRSNKKDKVNLTELVGGLNATMGLQREILVTFKKLLEEDTKPKQPREE